MIRYALTQCLLWATAITASQVAVTQEKESGSTLSAKPNRCVSLNRGQVCFQKVTLRWSHLSGGKVCLVSNQSDDVLKCWQQQTAGEMQVEIASQKDVNFILINDVNGEVLAEALVQIAWVYKQRREQITSWRLF